MVSFLINPHEQQLRCLFSAFCAMTMAVSAAVAMGGTSYAFVSMAHGPVKAAGRQKVCLDNMNTACKSYDTI